MSTSNIAMGHKTYAGWGVQSSALGTSTAATEFQQIYPSTSLNVAKGARNEIFTCRRNLVAPTQATKGKLSVAGGLSFPLTPAEYSHSLMWGRLFGNNNSVSGSSTVGYTHTFNLPTQASHLPSYGATIELLKNGEDTTLLSDYVGCFLNKMTLTIPEDGPIDISEENVGVQEDLAGTISTASYSSIMPYEASMSDLKIASVIGSVASIPFKTASVSMTNNYKMLFAQNGRVPSARSIGEFDATIEFTRTLKEDSTEYLYWKNDTEMAIQLVLTHTTLAGSSSGVYSVTLNFPRVIFKEGAINVEGTNDQTHKMVGKVMHDPVTGYAARAIVVNAVSGTYAV